MSVPESKLFSLVLILLALLPAKPALGENNLTDDEIKTILREYIDTDKLGVGIAVGIVDEHGTHIVCDGKLDNGTDADVNGDTLFEIGSITKVFTALLLQDMVDRGEMKLDDPVQKYLPKGVRMPTYNGKQVTLLDLATHTSGLTRDVNNLSPPSWRNPYAGYTVEQLYDFLNHCHLQWQPGTRWEYSNLGFQLLGYVIALKAGTNYESLVVNRICRPLGMDSTRVAVMPELRSRLAVGHILPGYRVPDVDFSFLPGAGGLHSSVNDLLKFVSAWSGLTPSPLAPLMHRAEGFHTMTDGTKRRLAWGSDATFFEHEGGTLGHATLLAFDVKTRQGIVVLSNCRCSTPVNDTCDFIDSIRGPLLAERSAKPANAESAETELYDRYTGQYASERWSGGHWVDVTARVKSLVANGVRVIPADNAMAGCDPAYGISAKQLSVVYTISKPRRSTVAPSFWRSAEALQGQTITLLAGAEIISARYGFLAGSSIDDSQRGISKDSNSIVIRREGGRLVAQWWIQANGARYPGYKLFQTSTAVFANDFWGVQATFSQTTNELVLSSIGPYSGFTDRITLTKFSTNIPAVPVTVHLDPQTYDKYVGRYRISLFGLFHVGPNFNIRRETDQFGDHLVGYVTGKHINTYIPVLAGNVGAELLPKSETVFFNPLAAGDLRITFDRNKTGKAKDVVIELYGSTFRATRVSDKPAS